MSQIKTNPKEIILTALMFGLVADMVLAGAQLIGIVNLPDRLLPYIGGCMVGYVVVGGIVVTHLSVKFMLKKG